MTISHFLCIHSLLDTLVVFSFLLPQRSSEHMCVCVCACVRVYVLTLGYLLREQLLGYRINTSSAQLVTASLLFNMVILVHISAGSV